MSKDIYLTNGIACKAQVLASIARANKSIRVAMAYFTDREIADQLILAQRKGITVSVVLDADPKNDKIRDVLMGRVELFIFRANGFGMMHHKFCIIDHYELLHGTFNYTNNAAKNNRESMNVLYSAEAIEKYADTFQALAGDPACYRIPYIQEPVLKTPTDDNYLERFTETLKNHIAHIFDDFDQATVVEEGRHLSEKNDGSEAVFLTYLDRVLGEVNSRLSQNEQIRTTVKTNMTASLERAIETNNDSLDADLQLLTEHGTEKNQLIEYRIEQNKSLRKEKQEEFQQHTVEADRIRSQIAELKTDNENLDRELGTKRFWSISTGLQLFLVVLLMGYLSLFFASAFWKIFFEEAEIITMIENDITPPKPLVFDADALLKIFEKKGNIFGVIASLLFILPVLASSAKLFVRKYEKTASYASWVVGIFLFDVLVAYMVSQHAFNIKQMQAGTSDQELPIWETFKTIEFLLILPFGAIPLILVKFLLENIVDAYHASNPESRGLEKVQRRKANRQRITNREGELSTVEAKLNQLQEELSDVDSKLSSLENELQIQHNYLNNKRMEFKQRVEKRNTNLREIYNAFIASVDSGSKEFIKNLVGGRVTAFRQGYFSHLNGYYHQEQAQKRIGVLEAAHRNWLQKNFE